MTNPGAQPRSGLRGLWATLTAGEKITAILGVAGLVVALLTAVLPSIVDSMLEPDDKASSGARGSTGPTTTVPGDPPGGSTSGTQSGSTGGSQGQPPVAPGAASSVPFASRFAAPGRSPGGITWNGTSFLVTDHSSTLFRLDRAGRLQGEFASPAPTPLGIVWTGSAFQLFTTDKRQIYEFVIEQDRLRVLRSFETRVTSSGGGISHDMAWDGESLYLVDRFSVLRIDRSGNSTSLFTSGKEIAGLEWAGNVFWVAYRDFPNTAILERRDSSGQPMTTHRFPVGEIVALTWADGNLWALGRETITSQETGVYQLDVSRIR